MNHHLKDKYSQTHTSLMYPLLRKMTKKTEAHQVILNSNSAMPQLFETFTRVWEAGRQTSLILHTLDGQARATLDIQLGPSANFCPGAPDAGKEKHVYGPLLQSNRAPGGVDRQLELQMSKA